MANYEYYGFKVTAQVLPDACTACPFWLVNTEGWNGGMCFLTGSEIAIDGKQDEKRMDDCRIEERKEE